MQYSWFHHINDDNNPVDILSKYWAYAQV